MAPTLHPITKYDRALEVWHPLVRAAAKGETYTYTEIADLLGFRGLRPLWQFLEPVMRFCDGKNLPPLTVLVAQKNTSRSGNGLLTSTDSERDQDRVFDSDWRSVTPPTVEDLEAASIRKG